MIDWGCTALYLDNALSGDTSRTLKRTFNKNFSNNVGGSLEDRLY